MRAASTLAPLVVGCLALAGSAAAATLQTGGYPSPAAEASADGSTTVYFGPTRPEVVARGNWIQTMPGKGWFVILRLYSPLEPFFTMKWRPTEIALVP